MRTCYVEYFWHDWSCTLKLIIATCRKVWYLTASKNINFIPLFFLGIMRRYCKLVICGTLGMSGYGHQKWWYQLVENFDVYLHAKHQTYSSPFSWNISNVLQICYFEYFEHAWPGPPKTTVSTCRKLSKISVTPHFLPEIL